MPAKPPPDYERAAIAYSAFYNDQPQVFFEDLNPMYQMRWVRAIRAVNGVNGSAQSRAWTPARRKAQAKTMRKRMKLINQAEKING